MIDSCGHFHIVRTAECVRKIKKNTLGVLS